MGALLALFRTREEQQPPMEIEMSQTLAEPDRTWPLPWLSMVEAVVLIYEDEDDDEDEVAADSWFATELPQEEADARARSLVEVAGGSPSAAKDFSPAAGVATEVVGAPGVGAPGAGMEPDDGAELNISL